MLWDLASPSSAQLLIETKTVVCKNSGIYARAGLHTQVELHMQFGYVQGLVTNINEYLTLSYIEYLFFINNCAYFFVFSAKISVNDFFSTVIDCIVL